MIVPFLFLLFPFCSSFVPGMSCPGNKKSSLFLFCSFFVPFDMRHTFDRSDCPMSRAGVEKLPRARPGTQYGKAAKTVYLYKKLHIYTLFMQNRLFPKNFFTLPRGGPVSAEGGLSVRKIFSAYPPFRRSGGGGLPDSRFIRSPIRLFAPFRLSFCAVFVPFRPEKIF